MKTQCPVYWSSCTKLNPTTNNSNPSCSTKRKGQRNIIWYSPPFSKSVKSNVARDFLKLLDKHFPTGNPLHKLFNRNTVKVSYSCMPNVMNIISGHNKRIISKNAVRVTSENCNCCRKPSEWGIYNSIFSRKSWTIQSRNLTFSIPLLAGNHGYYPRTFT